MESAVESYAFAMNTQMKSGTLPVTIRAAISFAIPTEGKTRYIAFGSPPYPDVESKGDANDPTPTCFNCNRTGHIAKRCPKPRAKKCMNCNEVGHTINKCPLPIKCTACGSTKHTRYDCTRTPGNTTKGQHRADGPTVGGEILLYLHPSHISHAVLQFSVSYHKSKNDTELTHTNINMKLWESNTKDIEANFVSVESQDTIQALVEMFNIDLDTITTWASKQDLMHVKIHFCPHGPAALVGTNFFTTNAFGEFTDDIEAIRARGCSLASDIKK
jgi:Zinc knuckle